MSSARHRQPTAYTNPTELVADLQRLGNYCWRIEVEPPPSGRSSTGYTKRMTIMEGLNGEDAGPENLDWLAERLQTLGPGQYSVASAKPYEGNNWPSTCLRTPFSVAEAPTAAVAGIGSPIAAGYLPKDQVQALIGSAVKEVQLQHQIADLQRQIQEGLGAEPPSRLDRFIDAITPHLGDILPPIMDRIGMSRGGQRAVLSGFQEVAADEASPAGPATEGPAVAPNSPEELQALLERWEAADEDWPAAIAALVNLAETDPSKYATGKQLLGL